MAGHVSIAAVPGPIDQETDEQRAGDGEDPPETGRKRVLLRVPFAGHNVAELQHDQGHHVNGVVGPNIVFQGVNVHVRSGIGTGGTDGTGDLIVGWDDRPFAATQRGGTPGV